MRDSTAREIISNKNVGIISCYGVDDLISIHDSKLIKWIKMPIQRDNIFKKKINYSFYKKVLSEIAHYSNDIDCWFVAAGIHGKIFCNYIKINNGIAIDIGSSIDSWKNIYNSRGYLKNIYNQSNQ